MERPVDATATLIKKYFAGVPDFTNRFYSPANGEEIEVAEEMLEISFPADYKNFLLHSDGFEGFIGDNYLRLIPVGYIYENTQDYCSESRPWAIYLGTNAGGEMVVLDKRKEPCEFGMLPYLGDDEDFIALGDTFEKFILRYYTDDIFG
jgi:hypothetical protein